MRWSESSENQWVILKKKEQPTLQVAEVQFRQTWWTWEVSQKKSHKVQNSALGLHLCILGTDWLSSLAEIELQITQTAKWNGSQESALATKGKPRGVGSKEPHTAASPALSTASYFKPPRSKRKGRTCKGSPSSSELWGQCLKIMWWSWVWSVSQRGSSSRVT